MTSTYDLIANILNIDEEISKNFKGIKFSQQALEEQYRNYSSNKQQEIIMIPSTLILLIHFIKLFSGFVTIGIDSSTGFSLIFFIVDLLIFGFFAISLHKKKNKVYNNMFRRLLFIRVWILFFEYCLSLILAFFSDNYNMKFYYIKLVYSVIILKNSIYLMILPDNLFIALICHLAVFIIMLFFFILSYVSIQLNDNQNIVGNDKNGNPVLQNYSDFLYHIKQSFNFVDVLIETSLFIGTYILKRYVNISSRESFIEKFKFKYFFKYCDELISGLNGYHVSFLNSKFAYMSNNLKIFLNYKYKKIYKLKNENINHHKIQPQKTSLRRYMTLYNINAIKSTDISNKNVIENQLNTEINNFNETMNLHSLMYSSNLENHMTLKTKKTLVNNLPKSGRNLSLRNSDDKSAKNFRERKSSKNIENLDLIADNDKTEEEKIDEQKILFDFLKNLKCSSDEKLSLYEKIKAINTQNEKPNESVLTAAKTFKSKKSCNGNRSFKSNVLKWTGISKNLKKSLQQDSKNIPTNEKKDTISPHLNIHNPINQTINQDNINETNKCLISFPNNNGILGENTDAYLRKKSVISPKVFSSFAQVDDLNNNQRILSNKDLIQVKISKEYKNTNDENIELDNQSETITQENQLNNKNLDLLKKEKSQSPKINVNLESSQISASPVNNQAISFNQNLNLNDEYIKKPSNNDENLYLNYVNESLKNSNTLTGNVLPSEISNLEISQGKSFLAEETDLKMLGRKKEKNLDENKNLVIQAADKNMNLNNEEENYERGLKRQKSKDLVGFEKNHTEKKFPRKSRSLSKLFVKKQTLAEYKKSKFTKRFKKLGEFYIELNEKRKFFSVYYRKVNKVLDIIFYDYTKVKEAENISSENKIKHKILSKIAHEFKTPLNSILGLINNLKSMSDNYMVNRDLNIIQALSNYTIYLISDVIQYASNDSSNDSPYKKVKFMLNSNTNINNNNNNNNRNLLANPIDSNKILQLNQNVFNNYSNNNIRSEIEIKNNLNIFINKIDVRKSLFFCFDILNALLSCYESKKDFIKTELFIEDKLNLFSAETDEIRVNQILLNFISNSVKFTKRGKIALIANFVNKKNIKDLTRDRFYLKISVVDTGMGISDEDQKKLFTEEIKLNTRHDFNQQGSGLGLSICANLIKLLNVKIEFASRENLGSIFSVLIPATKNPQLENNPSLSVNNINNLNMNYNLKNFENGRRKGSVSFKINQKTLINKISKNNFNEVLSNSTYLENPLGLIDGKIKNFTAKNVDANESLKNKYFNNFTCNFNNSNKPSWENKSILNRNNFQLKYRNSVSTRKNEPSDKQIQAKSFLNALLENRSSDFLHPENKKIQKSQTIYKNQYENLKKKPNSINNNRLHISNKNFNSKTMHKGISSNEGISERQNFTSRDTEKNNYLRVENINFKTLAMKYNNKIPPTLNEDSVPNSPIYLSRRKSMMENFLRNKNFQKGGKYILRIDTPPNNKANKISISLTKRQTAKRLVEMNNLETEKNYNNLKNTNINQITFLDNLLTRETNRVQSTSDPAKIYQFTKNKNIDFPTDVSNSINIGSAISTDKNNANVFKFQSAVNRNKENILKIKTFNDKKNYVSDENSSECTEDDRKIIIFPNNLDPNLKIVTEEESKFSAYQPHNNTESIFMKNSNKSNNDSNKQITNELSNLLQNEKNNQQQNCMDKINLNNNQDILSPIRYNYNQSNWDNNSKSRNELSSPDVRKNSNTKVNIITEYCSVDFDSDLIIENYQNIYLLNELINITVPFNKNNNNLNANTTNTKSINFAGLKSNCTNANPNNISGVLKKENNEFESANNLNNYDNSLTNINPNSNSPSNFRNNINNLMFNNNAMTIEHRSNEKENKILIPSNFIYFQYDEHYQYEKSYTLSGRTFSNKLTNTLLCFNTNNPGFQSLIKDYSSKVNTKAISKLKSVESESEFFITNNLSKSFSNSFNNLIGESRSFKNIEYENQGTNKFKRKGTKFLTNISKTSKISETEGILTKRISFNLNLENRYEKLNPELYPPKRRSSAEETSKSPDFLLIMKIEESRSSFNRKKSLSLDQAFLCKEDLSGIFSFRNEMMKFRQITNEDFNIISLGQKTFQHRIKTESGNDAFTKNFSQKVPKTLNYNKKQNKCESKFKNQNNISINSEGSNNENNLQTNNLEKKIEKNKNNFIPIPEGNEKESFEIIDCDDEVNKNLQNFNRYNHRSEKFLNTFYTKNENFNSIKNYKTEVSKVFGEKNQNNLNKKNNINNSNSDIANIFNDNNNNQMNSNKRNSDYSNYSLFNENQINQIIEESRESLNLMRNFNKNDNSNIKNKIKERISSDKPTSYIDISSINNNIMLNNNIIINESNLQKVKEIYLLEWKKNLQKNNFSFEIVPKASQKEKKSKEDSVGIRNLQHPVKRESRVLNTYKNPLNNNNLQDAKNDINNPPEKRKGFKIVSSESSKNIASNKFENTGANKKKKSSSLIKNLKNEKSDGKDKNNNSNNRFYFKKEEESNLPKNNLEVKKTFYNTHHNSSSHELNNYEDSCPINKKSDPQGSSQLNKNILNDNSLIYIVIDDNLHIRNAEKNLLNVYLKNWKKSNQNSKLAFDVIDGGDGIDALKFVIDPNLSTRIRAIFIDENMEYMNGSEAIAIIRKLQSLNKIPKFNIATVTAFEDAITKNNIMQAGVDEIYPKPFNKNHLVDFFNKFPFDKK